MRPRISMSWTTVYLLPFIKNEILKNIFLFYTHMRVRPSVRQMDGASVSLSDGWSVRLMFRFLITNSFHENHRGCPNLTLWNVLDVLDVLDMHHWPSGPCSFCSYIVYADSNLFSLP